MFRLISLNHFPIYEQLQLEEALLRSNSGNWCLLNTGSPPAIVMGISGRPEQLLDTKRVIADSIPVIKRFSGGGTVYVDSDTIFVTWICDHSAFEILPNPKPILNWSEAFYQNFFKGMSLRENDFVFGEKKFGGNAQYLQKSRWLLHTSFLWDFKQEKMEYLLLPEKRPAYRGSRTHSEFLCTLRPLFPNKVGLVEKLADFIQKKLSAVPASLEEVCQFLQHSHRRSTQLIHHETFSS
jgi:lipoate---protein ligase